MISVKRSKWHPKIIAKIDELLTRVDKNRYGKKISLSMDIQEILDTFFTGIVVEISPENKELIRIIFDDNQQHAIFEHRLSEISFSINLTHIDPMAQAQNLIVECEKILSYGQSVFITIADLENLQLADCIVEIAKIFKIKSIFLSVENEITNWELWFKFYERANFDKKIKLKMCLSTLLNKNSQELNRFLGEDIGIVAVNEKDLNGALEKTTIDYLIKLRSQCLLEFKSVSDKCNIHAGNYIKLLEMNDTAPNYLIDAADKGFEPMQPLFYNLVNDNYAIFEMDPVKYKLYQEAITLALTDRVSDSEKHWKISNVMILGAGRGPLVKKAFEASQLSGRKIRIVAIEKNPIAFEYLKKTVSELREKGAKIYLFQGDMRTVKIKDYLKADIFVSELLGAFGCNELSPECLDGAESNGLLKPNGISIPQSYQSHIRPIMSWRLVNFLKQSSKHSYQDLLWTSNFENFVPIDESQQLWEFKHPRSNRADGMMTNERSETLTFAAQDNVVLHGVAGYFSTTLYKHIEFNIVPETHTVNLISWWPLFFSAKTYRYLKKGETFSVTFERKIDDFKVWYEWTFDNGKTSNINGLNNPLLKFFNMN